MTHRQRRLVSLYLLGLVGMGVALVFEPAIPFLIVVAVLVIFRNHISESIYHSLNAARYAPYANGYQSKGWNPGRNFCRGAVWLMAAGCLFFAITIIR